MHSYFTRLSTIRRLCQGTLREYVGAYAALLKERGYGRFSARMQILCISDFSRWLERRKIRLTTMDEQTLQRYLQYRRRRNQLQRGDAAALQRLLEQLRRMEVVRSKKKLAKVSRRARTTADFGRYLLQQRRLSEATLKNYLPFIDLFLRDRFKNRKLDLSRIRASDVIGFVQRHAHTLISKRAQTLVTSLRSFLRYLQHQGQISADLAACVPTVAIWSLSTLPKFLPPGAVQKVLRQCNRQTAVGRRDYSILLLLARLGLRAGEVVALNLDDIDWGAGTITVHGKGGRWAQLPLPNDVGKALATYLKRDRPRCPSRRVFIRKNAPHNGFANSIAISTLVMRYLRRAEIDSARKGAHVFRHTLATDLLRQGCSLDEIGELLRHQSPDTTAIYAKSGLASFTRLGAAMAWRCAMTELQQAIRNYLALRRGLGFKLRLHGPKLQDFASFLARKRSHHITTALALEWATQHQHHHPSLWATRLSMVRGFARYRSATDPATEIPPLGLLPFRPPRARPYLYSAQEIRRLLDAARARPSTCSLSALTHYCFFGLLAVTGLRVSEAINLLNRDVDCSEGILTIRDTKFGKSRLVPLHPSTRKVLVDYARQRDNVFPSLPDSHFLVNQKGRRLDSGTLRLIFYALSRKIGLRSASDRRGPRLHDFRHRFAVETILRWYRAGFDPKRRLPVLSTYLGHGHVTDTYWYLTATPELMEAASQRLEKRWEVSNAKTR